MTIDLTGRAIYPLAELIELAEFPLAAFLPPDEVSSVFDGFSYAEPSLFRDGDDLVTRFLLVWEEEVALPLPGGFELVLGSSAAGIAACTAEIVVGPDPALSLEGVSVSLRFPPGVLEDVSTRRGAEVTLTADVRFGDGLVAVSNLGAVVLRPARVAGTSLTIEAEAGGPGQAPLPGGGGGGGGDALPLDLHGFRLTRDSAVLSWHEPHLGRWLGQVSPDLADESPADETELSLRVLFDDDGVLEVRVDAELFGPPRALALPGLDVEVPGDGLLSLVLGGSGRGLGRVAVVLTLAPSTEDGLNRFVARSTFAWERGEQRDVQHDEERGDAPLLEFTLTPKNRVSLLLLELDLGEARLPRFLRQLVSPVPTLDPADVGSLHEPTPLSTRSLAGENWELDLDLNLSSDFTLPFLKSDDESAAFSVRLTPRPKELTFDLDSHTVALPIGVAVTLGSMELSTTCDLVFNWETFAFSVDHDAGLELHAAEPELALAAGDSFLGLRWRFVGKKVAEGRYHYFTLVTKDYNYQLQQAPGSSFEISYHELGDEPISFAITDFSLGGKGLDLTATVMDQPARLNGLETRFRFRGSKLEIRENRINDFTLMGTGPMPPDLVGDATVDIALQLAQRDGHLTLVSGSARLQGDQLLECKGTRFRFALDAIGLEFVHEDGFHLYFTLTGSAQFTLAPGDDADGPLALLSRIRIDLVDCPLTGDARVIAKHVRFLVELPRPIGFSFLGAFDMEIRGIGFVPQAEVFDGDGAMLITGKLRFAQGPGDTPDPRVDVHRLLIGLPERGSLVPRIHFENLPVNLNLGSAFRLNGVVDFHDGELEKGFSGEGSLQIQGLPTMAASFSFLRVRRDETSPWMRAWFLFLEVRQVSFMIPVVQLHIREVGLGFGYRYTLASIKAADEANDVKELVRRLTELSRTQGDLSRRDRWAIDLEPAGQEPRWTVAARALISQTTAATSPLHYDEAREKDLACLFLLDAVLALRSDLTFLMAFRGWLNANYHDFLKGDPELRERPLLSGFVLLSPRHRRLLAHAASNPNGKLGPHPPLPEFVQRAIANSQFSATLLVEPGLLHYELGWPNMLRWKDTLGPLEAEFRGGMIFRVSGEELVSGTSFLARAKLELKGEVNLGVVGARAQAVAEVVFGARYIGLIDLRRPLDSALYGGIGLEMHVRFSIEFWIRLKIGFIKIQKTFRFSLAIDFTAGLEIGIAGIGADAVGLRGSGTLSVSVLGRSVHLSIHLGLNEGAVERARLKTAHVMNVGLEATDVDALPGLEPLRRSLRRALPRALGGAETVPAPEPAAVSFGVPGYVAFVVRDAGADAATSYVVLVPDGRRGDGGAAVEETGFLPAPPPDGETPAADFRIAIPQNGALDHYDPVTQAWVTHQPVAGRVAFDWRAAWNTVVAAPTAVPGEAEPPFEVEPFTLRRYLRHAYVTDNDAADPQRVTPVGDPPALPEADQVEDARTRDPRDDAFESAVRGAVDQFQGSPFFRRDPASEYERLLEAAYRDETTIYHEGGGVPPLGSPERERMEKTQEAHHLRGLVVHDLVADLREHADLPEADAGPFRRSSIAFQLGLVLRIRGERARWLDEVVTPAEAPSIRQRRGTGGNLDDEARPVRAFNVRAATFAANPPTFQRIQQLTDARTIAIDWDLVWARPPQGGAPDQADPEHHLMHYHVRRRSLDSGERELVLTVKPAHTLHRETGEENAGGDLLRRLRPRFQLVDHFAADTLEELAALPSSGRSYLYTITPVDFAGTVGRPLTVVATRRSSEPPPVPVDGELVVTYRIDASSAQPGGGPVPRLLAPHQVRLTWSEPPAPRDGVAVAVARHRLVFRRDAILPVGSYGLDTATGGPPTRTLPTTNARPLPGDAVVQLDEQGPADARFADVDVADLVAAGVFPGADALWLPESYRVYVQTESPGGVPSALAPVHILLRVEPAGGEAQRREERRPGELEWLPRPLSLPFLPPEDQQGSPGTVHVPMPSAAASDPQLRFGGTLEHVEFAQHPAGLRCVRFRWNQGASAAGAPTELSAGFEILELDVDAHPRDTFLDAARLASALRPIQDVQLVPAADLALAPGDTTNPSQWEAWYPSTVRRPVPVAGASDPGGWYSWRDSLLVWPAWPGLTDGDERRGRPGPVHPALQTIVDALSRPADEQRAPFLIDLQAGPPTQGGQLRDLLRATAATADPYGWGVLQRLGLAVAFSVRDPSTGEVLRGQDLLAAVHSVVGAPAWTAGTAYATGDLATHDGTLYRSLDDHAAEPGPAPDALPGRWLPVGQDLGDASVARHLHVELLFQPGRSIRLARTPSADPGELLALVQISMRPTVQQRLRYRAVEFVAPPGQVDLLLVLPPGAPCSVLTRSRGTSGQVELAAGDVETVIGRAVEVPLDGRAAVLLRGASPPDVAVPLAGPLDPGRRDALAQEFGDRFAYATVPVPNVRVLAADGPLPRDRAARLTQILGGAEAAGVLASIETAPLDPTSLRAAGFQVSPGELAAAFTDGSAAGSAPGSAAAEWQRFRRLLESLSNPDPATPAGERITIPTSVAELAAQLPEILAWSQRFFDAGGPIAGEPGELASTVVGPWTATAYPRAGAPALAAPDPGGRLTVDHLVEDGWAHAYRYYIRPLGRYDLLWQSLRSSPLLFPTPPAVAPVRPDPLAGGLDVVLERTRPVAPPLVLASSRLDGRVTGRPSPPGPTWEVIVARHPEQALVEKNQTLVRRLGFRQVAFALVRRFAFAEWPGRLARASGTPRIEVEPVEHVYPPVPPRYPETPDHLDLGALSPDEARSMDLPVRVPNLSQATQVLQWEGLPFFYEHRLLLVAQTASTTSPVVEVVQRDVEYRAPVPVATVDAAVAPWQPGEGEAVEVRGHAVTAPLRRLWESLPASAQQRWPAEEPGQARFAPSWIADLDVVYQLVEVFSGNVEVQAELFFDHQAERFVRRSLGGRFAVDIAGLAAPSSPAGRYELALLVQPVTDIELTRDYDAAGFPQPTRSKLTLSPAAPGRPARLKYTGLVTHADRANLAGLDPIDRAAIDRLWSDAFSVEPVSAVPPGVPAELADFVDTRPADDCRLVWPGRPSAVELSALQALPGDAEFLAAVGRLVAAAQQSAPGEVVTATAPRGPEHLPESLHGKAELVVGDGRYEQLSWTGPLTADDEAALADWARIQALAVAVRELARAVANAEVSVPVAAAAPLPEELPALLAGRLARTATALTWTGPPPTAEQRALLAALDVDPPLAEAVSALVAACDAHVVTVPFTSPVRPVVDDTHPLAAKLVIGRALLRVHGLMTRAEARALQAAFPLAADRLAVARLHRSAGLNGLRGRDLRVRALRGSAPPSPLVPLDHLSL